MSTYTCPHCGEHGLSTQKRHWCPEAPKISEVLRLGPPRSRDPIANEYIDRLTRELEEARELLRELAGGDEAGLAWDRGWRCVYCDSRARYTVLHDGECPIVRARRVLANTDTAGPQSADREERRESD